MDSFTTINLVQSLQHNAGYHVTTLKFAKFLHTLLTKHNLQVSEQSIKLLFLSFNS